MREVLHCTGRRHVPVILIRFRGNPRSPGACSSVVHSIQRRMPQSSFVVPPLPQDLHVHTVFSKGDSSGAPEQTVTLISPVAHARILGLSDHTDGIVDSFTAYGKEARRHGLRLGTEVDGSEWVAAARALPVECFI
jgi:hypothetical protein